MDSRKPTTEDEPQPDLEAAAAFKLPFGKHKGTPLRDVPPDYLQWVTSHCQGLNPTIKRLLAAWLDRAEAEPITAAAETNGHHEIAAPAQPSEILDRMPPSDVEAEQCLIGSLMLRPELLAEVEQIVMAGHFHSEANGTIYELLRTGRTGDVLLLRYRLKKLGKLADVGGDAYLAECAMAVPNAGNAVGYARIVEEKYLLRSLVQMATRLLRECYADTADPLTIATEAAAELERIVSNAKRLSCKATYEPF